MTLDQILQPAAETLRGWIDTLGTKAPHIVAALLVLLLALLASRIGRAAIVRLAKRASARNAVARLLGTLTGLAVLFLGLFAALSILGLNRVAASMVAGAGVLGLAVGLAAQSIASSMLAGTVISMQKPYAEGDLIEVGNYFGTVDRIELRVTRLLTLDGQYVLIPNKEILDKPVVNFSQLGRRRVDLDVGVSYGEDLERAAEIAVNAVEAVPGRIDDREVELFYREFGASSINFQVRFWIPFRSQPDYLEARSEAIQRIKTAFDEHGVVIPFPIRTLDFGIKGGTPLTDVLAAPGSGS